MILFAHRGASGEFPENSLLAFEQAIEQGADAIELDVQFHLPSQKLIVIHDHFVDKTTPQQGHINHFSLTELSQMPLGKGQYLLSLTQALSAISGRVLVNVELKTTPQNIQQSRNLVSALDTELKQAICQFNYKPEQLIISAFDHQLLVDCYRQMPAFNYAALIAHNPIDNGLSLLDERFFAINLAIDCLSPQLVSRLKAAHKKVFVYTVDKQEDIKQCWSLSVDGIFTNFPKISRNIIERIASPK
ncbi:glycerophosphodiester phosphodiesterase [Thalassotalea sediminis]|uniref:glycerophosphodiester phosphodiesterase n=1 Tax=Thalassotalea sediminis TaxID=1759089 RepID=UPI0025737BF2|nr:glycerophosphodiester phosphodiesterase family protein [Thalassotalea sediminis]